MKFDSEKSLVLGLLVWAPVGWGVLATLTLPGIVKYVMLLSLGFVAWIWFGTNYHILDGILKVQCGPFRQRINIKDIKSIKKTYNPLSSAALSLDRLQINYGYSGLVLISPKNRTEFIELLLKQNSSIQVKV